MKQTQTFIFPIIFYNIRLYWNTYYFQSPECIHHTVLSEANRNVAHGRKTNRCDRQLSEGWYRFGGAAGSRINTVCRGYSSSCDTNWAGWMEGLHPTVAEGRITRQVCFGYTGGGCCQGAYTETILVRNCGLFYVYRLTPVKGCNLRYCGVWQHDDAMMMIMMIMMTVTIIRETYKILQWNTALFKNYASLLKRYRDNIPQEKKRTLHPYPSPQLQSQPNHANNSEISPWPSKSEL